MPYCSTAIQTVFPDETENTIVTLAKEIYHAETAHPLTNGMWNIDGGENDVRAICRDENGLVKFFCRYEEEVTRTERKVEAFVESHPEKCQLVEC